ncbi:MAG: 30S ribosomal protein S6--L-glutamate ligase, partial [Bacteroidota bacterium]
MTLQIGILSRNPNLYSTRRLKQAIESKGHVAHIIDHLKCDINIEQDDPKIYYQGESLDFLDAVIPRIGSS